MVEIQEITKQAGQAARKQPILFYGGLAAAIVAGVWILGRRPAGDAYVAGYPKMPDDYAGGAAYLDDSVFRGLFEEQINLQLAMIAGLEQLAEQQIAGLEQLAEQQEAHFEILRQQSTKPTQTEVTYIYQEVKQGAKQKQEATQVYNWADQWYEQLTPAQQYAWGGPDIADADRKAYATQQMIKRWGADEPPQHLIERGYVFN